MKEDKFTVVGFLVLLSVISVSIVAVVLVIIDQYGEFEYTTSTGEIGTATFCTVSYGQSRCRTDDGTTIMVESYKKMNEVINPPDEYQRGYMDGFRNGTLMNDTNYGTIKLESKGGEE